MQSNSGASVDWVESSDSDDTSIDDETETPMKTILMEEGRKRKTTSRSHNNYQVEDTNLTVINPPPSPSFEEYNATAIRVEFRTYQSILPKPDKLLQQQHSFEVLRELIQEHNIDIPKFLRTYDEGGVKPHFALCSLLLDEVYGKQYVCRDTNHRPNNNNTTTNTNHNQSNRTTTSEKESFDGMISSWLIWFLSLGHLYRQINVPADIIREQFQRVAHVIPREFVRPSVLRKKIRNKSLPIPNFFLDPEDPKQFPPHIAILVILQDGEEESRHMQSILNRLAWPAFALMALILRIVLEVIGGAGAIWGGSEVFGLRRDDNKELWRWLSIGVGVLCLLRFVTLNAPQKEDEGDLLGPAGPWSLRPPVRLRAVTEHPFHYFARASPPFKKKKD